jgi:hypothetical protein
MKKEKLSTYVSARIEMPTRAEHDAAFHTKFFRLNFDQKAVGQGKHYIYFSFWSDAALEIEIYLKFGTILSRAVKLQEKDRAAKLAQQELEKKELRDRIGT